MDNLALIDGDIVCYRCAAANENADVNIAIWQAEQLLSRIMADTNSEVAKVWLNGENNFRYKLFPDYKANRRNVPKPKHLEHLREYLVTEWSAIITDGIETDDALGIESQAQLDRGNDEFVICSIDKDLLQLPGLHYNFVKRELVTISEFEGWYRFYIQCLVGDATDNISGCPGIGKAKAPRILDGITTIRGMYDATYDAYTRAKSIETFHLNAKLLYVLRREEEEWKPPQPETEPKSESTTEQKPI